MRNLQNYKLGIVFMLYLSMCLSVMAIDMGNIAVLIAAYIASIILYVQLVRHSLPEEKIVSKILISLSGFLFGTSSFLLISYLIGDDTLDLTLISFQYWL